MVDDILAQHNLPAPQGLRRLTPESQPVVDALAGAIAAEVDHLMAVRWSRSAGAILEAEPVAQDAVSTSACACGSGIPVTTVEVAGRAVQIMALEPVLELAYNQGLRADGALPPEILQTVQVYNTVPAGEEEQYAQALDLAWRAYCEQREGQNHG